VRERKWDDPTLTSRKYPGTHAPHRWLPCRYPAPQDVDPSATFQPVQRASAFGAAHGVMTPVVSAAAQKPARDHMPARSALAR